MPLVYANLVKETTTTTGTGALTLLGAVSGFFPFSTIGNLNTCKYEVEDATGNKEVGQGTYTLSSNTLSRDSVETSTNGNSLVNFGAGTKTVHLDVPASFFNSIPNSNLANSSLTVTAGSGLSGGGAVSLGGAVTLTASVTSVAGRTGAVTIANTDVSGLGGLSTLSAAPAGTLTGATLNATVVTSSLTTIGTLVGGSIPYSLVTGGPASITPANPTATIGLTAVNGSATTTFLRSDGAPALSQAIAPTWSGLHNFSAGINVSSGQVISWNSDSSVSRTATATLAIGNGAQGNASGSLCMGNATSSTAPSLSFGATTSGGNGFGLGTNGDLNWFVNGTPRLSVTAQGLQLWNTTGNLGLAFASSTYGTSVDASLQRTAPNTLAVGNGTAGDASGTINAATIGWGTGLTSSLNSNGTITTATITMNAGNVYQWTNKSSIFSPVDGSIRFNNHAGTTPTDFSFPVAGTWQQGSADATAPVAQTYRSQSVANTATANTPAPDMTWIAPLGLGSAATGGRHIWQIGAVRASGTTQQTATNAMILDNGGNLTLSIAGSTITIPNGGDFGFAGGASIQAANSGSALQFATSGKFGFFLGNTLAQVGADSTFGFSNTNGNANATLDTAASRISSNVWAFGNGSNGDFSGSLKFTTAIQVGKTTTYNNVSTVSGGIPSEIATVDSTGLAANVSVATLYAVPASGAGMYRVCAYTVLTTAASVSSTLPNIQIVYTDNETGGSITIDATPILGIAGIGQTGALNANTVGTASAGVIVVNAKASTNIQYQTVNYASTAAGMAYALHVKLEAL